jgi:hypothetical protein
MTATKDRHEIEEAIGFLVDEMSAPGYNPKPVILHSIWVG